MKKVNILLVIIITIAAILRLWQISFNPPSLTWDEVAWGYNAYSLGIDGKDEFGKKYPITYLESFGDFKPPVYAYLSIIPVKLFGLNEFSTRFASAFFGILTVLLTYYLTRELFMRRDTRNLTPQSNAAVAFDATLDNADKIALLSSGIMAISPWHILLSRAAFEANVATFFLVLGVYLFINSINKNSKILPLSIVSFIISMYTFNSARIVAPILVLVLTAGLFKNLLKIKKQLVISSILGLIIFIPLFLFLMTPQARLRFNEVNIFTDYGTVLRVNQEIGNDNFAWWSKVIHNRRFVFTVEYLKHYFDHFDPWFLFVKGDGNPKFSIQDVGQMYLWEFPFFIAGLLYLFKNREGRRWWIIPVWLLAGIIPAGTARETPHALRIEATLPTFQIITAYGLYQVISNFQYQISNFKLRKLIIVLISGFMLFNFLYFYHTYFNHYPREYSGEWQYGYKEAITYVMDEEKKYDKVYFTEKLGRPYAYILFYTRYDPKKFRAEAKIERETFGFVHVRSFGKYRFSDNIADIGEGGKGLYLDDPDKVPQNAQILKKFYLLNGNEALVAYTR